MSVEWKGALRLQIEALAKRNDLHRRCIRESVQKRTKEMDHKIIKMRELLSTDANAAAQYYLECVCHADETERILNRTSSRDRRRRRDGMSKYSPYNGTATIHSIPSTSVMLPEELPKDFHQFERRRDKWWGIHRTEQEYEENRNEVRQLWKSQNDFLTHALALVIGIGNIIRFPAAVFRVGGVLLIPYLVLQLFVGFPIVFLHTTIGQFSGLGPVSAFRKLAKAASGLGWAFFLVAIPFSVYFNIYAGWSLFYLTQIVFSPDLPWNHCDKKWNSSRTCCSISDLESCQGVNSTVLTTEVFIHSTELHVSAGALGGLQAPWAVCLGGAWLLTLLFSLKSTPLVHFTSTFPFLVLSVLFLCAYSLPGAEIGLSYLFNIKLQKLLTIEPWLIAGEQIFFELGMAGAPLISLAALNRFRNNVYRDSAILVFSCILASFLSALVVFSFAGNLSFLSGIEIKRLVAYDSRYFSFVVLPSMTSTIQAGSFWAALLFISLTLASIDAQFAWLHLLVSTVLRKLKSKNRFLESRLFAFFCVLFFLLGLPLCVTGGAYLFHSIDCLITTWSVALTSFLLLILVFYIYGPIPFLSDISEMLRSPLFLHWTPLSSFQQRISFLFGPTGWFIRYSWTIVSPFILLVMCTLFLFTREHIKFAKNPVPWPYEMTSWVIISAPLLAIPLGFLFEMYIARKNGQIFITLFDPSKWTQIEHPFYGGEPEPEEQPRSERKGRMAIRDRENTYQYIDPLSRGNTERSVTAIQIEDNYGWRVGRLREVQDDPSLQPSSSQPSFAASITSQTTNVGEIALFGSPPASNAFMLSEMISNRAAATRRRPPSCATDSPPPTSNYLGADLFSKVSSISEPPAIPSTPPPRGSPGARSEPPTRSVRAATDRPSSSLRSKSDVYSDDSEEEDGIRPQRVTVIRRYCSEDSFGLQSNTSISITPIDRQRSLSSVAIYDKETNGRPTKTLSQLKRPPPIDAPKSPTRF